MFDVNSNCRIVAISIINRQEYVCYKKHLDYKQTIKLKDNKLYALDTWYINLY